MDLEQSRPKGKIEGSSPSGGTGQFFNFINKRGDIVRNKKKILAVVWLVGLPLGLVFLALRLLRIVKVEGLEKRKLLPSSEGSVLYYRHPSLREPVFLPLAFFPWFLFDLRFVPFSTPDRDYYTQWWYAPLRPLSVAVSRKERKKAAEAEEEIRRGLAEGKTFLLAPGGGREKKGIRFKMLRAGRIEKAEVSLGVNFKELEGEAKGKLIRRFKPGMASLIQATGAAALPIWVESKGITTKIIFGKPFKLSNLSRKQINEALEDTLLKLGNKR